MQAEIEVKILSINKEEVIQKLKDLGAEELGSFNQRRYVYDVNDGDDSQWIRVRQKGSQTTIAYKKIVDDGIDGTKEVEVVVSDFETANELLKSIGFKPKSYQENRRTSFKLDNVEIEIDEWPKLSSYLEIEGPSSEKVYEVVEMLGYSKEDCTSINTMEIYAQNNIDLNAIKELKF